MATKTDLEKRTSNLYHLVDRKIKDLGLGGDNDIFTMETYDDEVPIPLITFMYEAYEKVYDAEKVLNYLNSSDPSSITLDNIWTQLEQFEA